jgi:enediyne biosynthesis protein E4
MIQTMVRLFIATATAAVSLAFGQVATAPFTVENVAPRSGLTFRQNNFATSSKYPFETMGGAVAAFDFDNDGDLDLLFLNGAPSPSHVRTDPASFNRLYRNNGGPGLSFTDVTASSGLSGEGIPGYPQGIATGDYDNDGFADVYVTNFGENVLYRNNGDGTFANVTAKSGTAMPGPPFKASACWVDVDNDGWLDLFVTRYFDWTMKGMGEYHCGDSKPGYRTYCRPDVFKPLANALFRNNRDGTFTDISEQAGLSKAVGKGMGAAIADYDDDGWMDIFVSNDKWPNFLYHNKRGTFEEAALYAGVWSNENGNTVSGMGCDFKDFNNDGRPDIFYTDLVTECFTLFVNRGKGIFTDASFPSNVGRFSAEHSGWSTKFMDWDNDGWKDILVAGSHVLDNPELYNPARKYKEQNFLYRNTGNGKFEDLSQVIGPDFREPGAFRGLAVGDFDNDGVLEAAFSRLNDGCVLFRRTGQSANHWILLSLRGTRSNRDAIGARIEATLPSGTRLYEHVTTANGIYSASDRRVHLGLGGETLIQSLKISWPSGIVQKLENVTADRILSVTETP